MLWRRCILVVIFAATYLPVISPKSKTMGTFKFRTRWKIAQVTAQVAFMKGRRRTMELPLHYHTVKEVSAPLILRLVAACIPIASHAGVIIRGVFQSGKLNVKEKAKNDYQTAADRGAQRFIMTTLSSQFPDVTIIGEEGPYIPNIYAESNFHQQEAHVLDYPCPSELKDVDASRVTIWVDPLDGTSEFARGRLDHVTVLIGIAVDSKAIAGIIHEPGHGKNGRTIWGIVGIGIFNIKPHKLQPIHRNFLLVTSRSQTDELVQNVIKGLNPTAVLYVGGGGHKALQVLEGNAHAYLFASKGMKKWDTCATEALFNASGGYFTDIRGQSYAYHKNIPFDDEYGLFAVNDKDYHADLIDKIPESAKINFNERSKPEVKRTPIKLHRRLHRVLPNSQTQQKKRECPDNNSDDETIPPKRRKIAQDQIGANN